MEVKAFWYNPTTQIIYDPILMNVKMRMWPHPPPYWFDPSKGTYGYGAVSAWKDSRSGEET